MEDGPRVRSGLIGGFPEGQLLAAHEGEDVQGPLARGRLEGLGSLRWHDETMPCGPPAADVATRSFSADGR